jgi:hypothetical protein
MNTPGDLRWYQALENLLRRSHLLTADRLAAVVDETAGHLGMRTTIWLIDCEQVTLRALPRPADARPGAGRRFPARPGVRLGGVDARRCRR